jgi:hypothetical protein
MKRLTLIIIGREILKYSFGLVPGLSIVDWTV